MKMEQNKFEKIIIQKVNSREIKPSEMAWEKLDFLLSENQKQTKWKTRFFLQIAASILIISFFGVYFFNTLNKSTDIAVSNSIENHDNTVVEQNDFENDKIYEQSVPSSTIIDDKIKSLKNNNIVISSNNHNIDIQKEKTSISNKQDTQTVIETVSETINKDQSVTSSNKQKKEIFQDDIDALLNSVSNKNPKLNAPESIKIDPNELLSQVDAQVEYTFREKMYKEISKKYNEIKTVVNTRNNIKPQK